MGRGLLLGTEKFTFTWLLFLTLMMEGNLTSNKQKGDQMIVRGLFVFLLYFLSYNAAHPEVAPRLLRVDCNGDFCGASGHSYTGEGIGVWTYFNDQNQNQPLEIMLDGLAGDTVTIVISNTGDQPATVRGDLTMRSAPPQVSAPAFRTEEETSDLQRYPAASPAETRIWQVPQFDEKWQGEARPYAATLRAQASLAGFRYRIWVADSEWTGNMQAQVPMLAGLLFGSPEQPGMLQRYLRAFPANPWGDYPVTPENRGRLPHDWRDIDFVIAPNGAGNLQFFDPTQTLSGPHSNHALVLFVGSEGLACKNGPTALCVDLLKPFHAFAIANNLLHELTHLVQHYQRVVRQGPTREYDLWLREATASSQGFSVAYARFPKIDPAMFEILPWFGGKYACSLITEEGAPGTATDGACAQNYYSSGQALLLYLSAQYGASFYAHLQDAPGNGVDALDAAIRASGGTGFAEAFRRWGGMLALLSSDAPASYSWSGADFHDFERPPLDGTAFTGFRKISVAVEGGITLAPFSNWLMADADQSERYIRRINIPSKVAVTVFVREGLQRVSPK